MTNEFLWKKLNEKEKLEIKKRAKEIMDNFAEKLKDIANVKESKNKFESNSRKEKISCKKEIDRSTMFENAPKKNKNFIIAETKNW